MTITLTLNAETLSEGQTISGSSFVSSVSDSARHSITQYSVYDSGADGGYFILNGKKLSSGAWTTLTAAQFAQLQYVAGSSAGSETISIKAYDGSQWSSAYSTTEKTTAPSGSSTIVSLLANFGITATTAQQLTANNSLTYNGMLTILQDAAAGGMTATKFSALKTLAGMLNAAGGLTTSTYVQQLADDVILGNSANSVVERRLVVVDDARQSQRHVDPDAGQRADRQMVSGNRFAEPERFRHRRIEPQSNL